MYARHVCLAVVGFCLIASQAFSGEVQERIDNQQNRIDQGVKSGELTPGEAANLEKHETRIEDERNRDLKKNGGKLTRKQHRRLNRQENRQSKRIYRKKHNDKEAADQ